MQQPGPTIATTLPERERKRERQREREKERDRDRKRERERERERGGGENQALKETGTMNHVKEQQEHPRPILFHFLAL